MKDEEKTKEQLVKELRSFRAKLAGLKEAERKYTEKALRKSEERFRTLYNHTPVMMHSIDEKGKLVSVNDYWLKVFGYEREEVVGQKSVEFLTEASRRYAVEVALPEFLETGYVRDIEYQMVKKNGDVIDILLSAVAVRDKKGELDYSLAFMVDITEHKRAEEALRKSEEQYRVLYEEAPLAYFSVGIDGHIHMVNQPAAELLGCGRDDLIGRPIFDLYADTPSGKERARRLFQQFLSGKEIRGEELEMRRVDGRPVWVSLTVRPIRDANGETVESRSMVVDITDRKRAEVALRESEERLSRILESAMDAIITIDEKHCIVLFNEMAEKVLRCPATKVIGQQMERYLGKNLQDLIINYMKTFGMRKKSRQYMWAPEGLTARRSDGKEFPFEATISHVEVSGEKLYTIILRDINERKRAETKFNKLQLEKIYLQEEIRSEYNFGEIIGTSNVMKKVFKDIEKVAATDSTVLLTGETGTGKELIARAIHNLSSRKDIMMVKVNCAALPAGLVESELFGHEKGAFTGATAKRKGRFELSDGSTIFLDEIGGLPLDAQSKLLRVLQEQEFERVGGTQTNKVNVRVIAATNCDLEDAVKLGAFRADLFYRLNIFPIYVPPLRERPDDIPHLANYFIAKFSRRMGKRIESINAKALEKLMSYNWLGNVRELANILERAVILCEGGVLQQDNIGISVIPPTLDGSDLGLSTLEEVERRHIMKALEKTGGILGGPKGAANLLGINRSTLWSRMRKLGCEYEKEDHIS